MLLWAKGRPGLSKSPHTGSNPVGSTIFFLTRKWLRGSLMNMRDT